MAGTSGSGPATIASHLHPRKQLLISRELVLPVAVDRRKVALRASAPEVEPANILAVSVERNAHGDFEFLATTGARALLKLGAIKVVAAVPNGMLRAAADTRADRRSLILVQRQSKYPAAAHANGV